MSYSDPDLIAEPGERSRQAPWRLIAIAAAVLATLCGVCLAVWGPCLFSCGTSSTPTPSAAPAPTSATITTSATSTAARITILVATAPGGSSLVVSGSGFTPSEDVTITVDGVTTGHVHADPTGAFAGYSVPVGWSPSRQVTVDARGVTSGRSATGQVTA